MFNAKKMETSNNVYSIFQLKVSVDFASNHTVPIHIFFYPFSPTNDIA